MPFTRKEKEQEWMKRCAGHCFERITSVVLGHVHGIPTGPMQLSSCIIGVEIWCKGIKQTAAQRTGMTAQGTTART